MLATLMAIAWLLAPLVKMPFYPFGILAAVIYLLWPSQPRTSPGAGFSPPQASEADSKG